MSRVFEVSISEDGPEVTVGYFADNNLIQLNEILNNINKALAIDFNKLPLLINHENGNIRRISEARLEGIIKSDKPKINYKEATLV